MIPSLGSPIARAVPSRNRRATQARVAASSSSWVRGRRATSPPRPSLRRALCRAGVPVCLRGIPRRSCAPPGYPSSTLYPRLRRVPASRIPRSASILMGPRVSGKNRIPRRRSSRSHSRKWGPERSSIVARPLGSERGASIRTRAGRTSETAVKISRSECSTDVRADREPVRMQQPVFLTGEPARSRPITVGKRGARTTLRPRGAVG